MGLVNFYDSGFILNIFLKGVVVGSSTRLLFDDSDMGNRFLMFVLHALNIA
jgi:hypothetical protein